MLVYVSDVNKYYALIGGTTDAYWVEFQSGSGASGIGPTGPTGSTGPQIVIINGFETTIDPIIVKGSSSYSLNGDTVTLTYAGSAIPATGSAFLTDSSKGTGFPAYFNSGSMNQITFSSQTITGNIGDTITLRIVVTGSGGTPSTDIYDYEIVIGNELRWGATSSASIDGGQAFQILGNALPISTIDEQEINVGLSNDTYLFVAHPVRHGEAQFSINNGPYGGVALQGVYGIPGNQTATATNDNGYAEVYYVYRSEQAINDSFTVRLAPT
jgi:hypothetical protein